MRNALLDGMDVLNRFGLFRPSDDLYMRLRWILAFVNEFNQKILDRIKEKDGD